MKFRFLKPGDRVGIVAPAGPVKAEQIEKSLQLLAAFNLQPVLAPHLFDNAGIVASTVANRLADLHAFYRDDTIAAVWAARGGYGTIQLLSGLDYALIRSAQKPIIGFSDITALQWGVWVQTGVTAFSGLALTLQANRENPYFTSAMDTIFGNLQSLPPTPDVEIVREGEAEGILLSGTLALITALVGTPFFPRHQNIILCIEDVDEPFYRIDRMFHQLKLSGFFQQVTGVLLGQFLWKNRSLNILPIISHLLPDNIPIVANLPYGHIRQSLLMPLGVPAYVITSPFRLTWKYPESNRS